MRAFPRNDPAWQELQHRKCHLSPGLARHLPPSISRKLGSYWAPVLKLLDMLAPLPEPLISFWARHPHGHLVFVPAGSRYLPGDVSWRGRTLRCVAEIGVEDLFFDEFSALSATARLLDHLLGGGCGAADRLSGGKGVTPALESLGAELKDLSALGYGPEGTESSAEEYFAWGFASYILDRRSLNVQDPLLEKLLRRTVFSAGFWQENPLPKVRDVSE